MKSLVPTSVLTVLLATSHTSVSCNAKLVTRQQKRGLVGLVKPLKNSLPRISGCVRLALAGFCPDLALTFSGKWYLSFGAYFT